MAFTGRFEHSLDAKNRLTVPAKFRAALSGTVYVVRGADPCVSVYPEAVYAEMARRSIAGMNPLSAQARRASRFFYSNADEMELDGAGRITLQSHHLEHAGIAGRETVIAGSGDCLEVWDRAAWQRYESDLMAHGAELTESLDHPA